MYFKSSSAHDNPILPKQNQRRIACCSHQQTCQDKNKTDAPGSHNRGEDQEQQAPAGHTPQLPVEVPRDGGDSGLFRAGISKLC